MQYGGYGRKYRVKPRFFIFLALLLGLAVWGAVAVISLFNPPRIEWGRLSSDQNFSAIVLRDETVVKAQEFSELECVATEGQSVTKDETVAMQYLTGFSTKDLANLVNLRNDIKDYQENNIIKDIKKKDLETFNSDIDKKMKEISDKAISRKTQDMAAAENELRKLMDDRKAYMLTIVNPDEELKRKYQLEATLQEKIERTRKPVASPADGLLSFYLDGYEDLLTVPSIEKLTPGTMNALRDEILKNKKPFKSAGTVLKDQAVCRVVNATKWYAVVVMNAMENPLVQGTDREVSFEGLQKAVTARVVRVMSEGRNSIAVLEVPEGVKEMLSLRLVEGHLGQDIEGFRVPLGMVKEEDGRAFLAIQGAGANVNRVEVRVLGRDDRQAIVEPAGEGELAIGLPLVRP